MELKYEYSEKIEKNVIKVSNEINRDKLAEIELITSSGKHPSHEATVLGNLLQKFFLPVIYTYLICSFNLSRAESSVDSDFFTTASVPSDSRIIAST